MADPLRGVSGFVHVLETNDEGKKKFKFKALRNFFGKKKKKAEAIQGGSVLKPKLPNSNINITPLKPLPEGHQIEPQVKRLLGNKALSHDSIFMLNPEREKSAIKLYSSPGPHRGRTMQRRYNISRTLPRTGPGSTHGDLSGIVFGSVPSCSPRSGIWAAGTKMTEVPPVHSRQPSISSTLIQSDTITEDPEEIAVDNESPKNLQKRTLPQVLTLKKSSSESISRPPSLDEVAMPDSPSSMLPSTSFKTPANTHGGLDTSAPQHKMPLSSRRQKKYPQTTVKTRLEEPSLLVSEEKGTTVPQGPEQKKLNKDSAGSSKQEQSNKTEIWDKKTIDQAANIDNAGSLGSPLSEPFGRKHGRKGPSPSETSESGSRGRNVRLSSLRLGLGDRGGSLPADKTASDAPVWTQSLEKLNVEQPPIPQAETTSPQEFLSDQDGMGMRNAGTDIEGRKVSASPFISEDVVCSLVSGPRLYHEEEASGSKKAVSRASYLPVVESLPTSQDVFSMAVEVQVFVDPSHFQSEEHDRSSFDSQNVRFEMESVEDITSNCKEKPPGNVLQALTASASAAAHAVAEGGIAMAERQHLRSLSQSLGSLEVEVSDSENTSEMEDDSDQPLTSECSLESFEMRDHEVSTELESLAVKAGYSKQQLAPKHSSQPTGMHQADCNLSSESGSVKIDSEQQLALRKPKDNPEVITASESFIVQSSTSDKQALGRSENKVSTKANKCVEKYHRSEDWSSSEGDLLLRPPSHILRNPKRQVVSFLKDIPEENSDPMQTLPPTHPSEPFVRLNAQQHVSSGAVSASTKWSVLARSPKHLSQSWLSPKVEQEASADPERAAVDWSVCIEPLPPRIFSKRQRRPKIGQEVSDSKGPEVPTPERVASVDLLSPKHSSQSPIKPIAEQKISAGPESMAVGRNISTELLLPSGPSQLSVRTVVGQHVLGADCAVVEHRSSAEPSLPRQTSQSLMRSLAQQQVSAGPECTASGRSISMEPLPPRNPLPPRVSPKFGPKSSFPESTAIEGHVSMEPVPPAVLAQSLMNPVRQSVFSGLEGAADSVIMAEPLLPQGALRSVETPQAQHGFSEDTAIGGEMFVGLPPPTGSLQPLVKPTFPPQVRTSKAASAFTEWCRPVEPMPPTHIFQPWVSPKFDSQVSAESVAIEWGISLEPLPPRMPSQRLMRPVGKQEVASGSVSASAEWDTTEKPLPPRGTFQPQMSLKFEQQVSAGAESTRSVSMEQTSSRKPSKSLMKTAVKQPTSSGPESVTVERGIAEEPLPPRHSWSSMRHKVYQASSSFQSATVEGVSRASVTTKNPTQYFMKPKIQQISSHLENIAAGGISKQLLAPRPPSQWFVKFMAQQIFSESHTIEGGVYVDPLASNQPAKSLWRPKVEPQVFSGRESAAVAEGISLKQLPSQSFGKPKDPHHIFSHSGSVPVKRSSSEEQLPFRQPSQGEGGTELQSQVFSTGLGKSSVEHSPLQPFANFSYQKPIHSSSMSAIPEGTTLESKANSHSLLKGPASPNKTKKHSSEDLTKNIPIPITKLERFISAPDLQIAISEGTYSKEEVLESEGRSGNHSKLPSIGTDAENLFGVRLKKVPFLQKYKSEKQGSITKLSSISLDPILPSIGREQQMRRSTSQGLLGITEDLTTIPEFVEKKQRRPISETISQKQSIYKIPGNSDRKSEYASSEPSWIAMVKQKSFLDHIPMSESKCKSRSGANAETKEHRSEGAGLAHTESKKTFTSNTNQQEKMALMKPPVSTKADENTPVPTKAEAPPSGVTRLDRYTTPCDPLTLSDMG
ncbi:PREDICTED: uncharacterized protein KIAA1210 homolog [Condylura cristata]|uniref:uncharacterized protein KIAA1210 homolog n=1 Tax=Condylura cristata TaxID=143302 RepID=UPI000642C152|nr:PREDICTED: uncharacterized protein KIAA1210 homolog [Condylura cristata]